MIVAACIAWSFAKSRVVFLSFDISNDLRSTSRIDIDDTFIGEKKEDKNTTRI